MIRTCTASDLELSRAMTHLPHYERQALSLRLRDNLKQTEIAMQLGCSQMQVSRLLPRATGRLRTMTAGPAERPARRGRSP